MDGTVQLLKEQTPGSSLRASADWELLPTVLFRLHFLGTSSRVDDG